MEIIKFVERVQSMTIELPESIETRELIHLHHFQKRLILMHLKQFKIYFKLKMERDWDRFITADKFPKIGKIAFVGPMQG